MSSMAPDTAAAYGTSPAPAARSAAGSARRQEGARSGQHLARRLTIVGADVDRQRPRLRAQGNRRSLDVERRAARVRRSVRHGVVREVTVDDALKPGRIHERLSGDGDARAVALRDRRITGVLPGFELIDAQNVVRAHEDGQAALGIRDLVTGHLDRLPPRRRPRQSPTRHRDEPPESQARKQVPHDDTSALTSNAAKKNVRTKKAKIKARRQPERARKGALT